MDKLSSRIGGDFNYEAMEAFRAAYAQQLASPNDDSVANASGLPTNTVANTSPWISQTGVWKYPSGKGPESDLKQPFNPNDYLSGEIVDEDEDDDSASDEEIESIIDSIVESNKEDVG